MKFQKIFFTAILACLMLTACKTEVKKETPTLAKDAEIEQLTMHISGMTCEIGCAKTIESKLAKKEGVLEAKVIFKDSVANVKFDANKINKADLMTFIDGIAGGEMYKASEIKNTSKETCVKTCKKECKKGDEKACSEACKKECKKGDKKMCSEAAKKACKKGDKKTCEADCKKDCCKNKK